MKLEDISFYTLFDGRARTCSHKSPLWRGELILTDQCNFQCPYCRGLRDDCRGAMDIQLAEKVLDYWISDKLMNVRFSGGEPTLYPYLDFLIKTTKQTRVKRIAVSTNGSSSLDFYKSLIDYGVNDFSVSLDACCSSVGKVMTGGKTMMWERITENIKELSKLTYVTVGIVFNEINIKSTIDIIRFAHDLGVADIRIISSAQYNRAIKQLDDLDDEILNYHPILKYRVNNFREGRNVRGITRNDTNRCYLVLDDMVIAGRWHFPCIIYLREHGEPIGEISENMRQERLTWFKAHNTQHDPICKTNCLDVCIDYNQVAHLNVRKNLAFIEIA